MVASVPPTTPAAGDGTAPCHRSRYRWAILGAGTLAQASFSSSSVGLPAIAPILRSYYHLSLAQVGFALAAIPLGMIPTMLVWGMVADRVGERAVIGVGLTAAGITMLAAALTHGFAPLLVLLTLFGAFGACVNAASGRAVMSWFSHAQRGLALGIRQTSVPIGVAVGAATLPWLTSNGRPSYAFVALGSLAIVGALVAILVLREGPTQSVGSEPTSSGPLLDGYMWRLAIGSGFLGVGQFAITGYSVLFLHEHRGLSTHSAALAFGAMNVVGVATRIAAGRWSDRIRSRLGPLRVISALMSSGTVAVAVLVDAPLVVLVPVLVLSGGLSMSWAGVAFTAAAEASGTARSGRALGFQQTVLAVIVTAATPAFAALVASTSWRIAFLVSAITPAVFVLLVRSAPESLVSSEPIALPDVPPVVA